MVKRDSTAGPVDPRVDRGRLRATVWLAVAAAVLALAGIFGFGGLTGAGEYFSKSSTEREVTRAAYYWQIWGILLPIAIATVISGIARFILAGTLARLGEGWTATVTRGAGLLVLPASILASAPYWLGPELDGLDLPRGFEAVAGAAGVVGFAAVIAMGVAMVRLPTPGWTGVALMAGAIAALVTFLPLFVFLGTFAVGVGLLRWDRRRSNAATDRPQRVAFTGSGRRVD